MMQSDGKAPAHIPGFSWRAEPKYIPLPQACAWAMSRETAGVKAPLAAPAPWFADQRLLFLIGVHTGWLVSSKFQHLLLGTPIDTPKPPFYHRILSIWKYFQLSKERLGIDSCLYKRQFHNSRPSPTALVVLLLPTVGPTFDNSFIWNYLFCQALTQWLPPPPLCYWWLIVMGEFLASVVIKNVTMNYFFSPVKLAMVCLKENSVEPVGWTTIAPLLVRVPGTSSWKVNWQRASELNVKAD